MDNYFEGFFREMPDPCVILRPEQGYYTICAVNEGYLRLVAKPRSEVIDRDFCALFPDIPMQEAALPTRRLLQRILRSKKVEVADPLFYPRSCLGEGVPKKSRWMQTTHIPILNNDGKVEIIVRFLRDVTDTMQMPELRKKSQRAVELDAFLELERKILSLHAAAGISMTKLLTEYLAGVESLFPGMYCSILRVVDHRLTARIAPSIPDTFLPATISLPIEEGAGSCGTAAYRKQLVVVTDIATDPIWEGPRELALAHGLMSCWSYPIIDGNNSVLAVLGMYYKEVKMPVAKEIEAVHRIASLLRILLENRRNANLIAEAADTLNQAQELASFGIWQWDTVTDEMTWSSVLYGIFGVRDSQFNHSKSGFLYFIVDEDKKRVTETLEHVRVMGEDTIFEVRIRRPDGSVRHLRCWVKLVKGGKYHPRVVGACLDVTAIKSAESDLKEIAWMQSHMIRAPVARILGLVDLIKNYPTSTISTNELLNAVYHSAQELDDVINAIVKKAEQKKNE